MDRNKKLFIISSLALFSMYFGAGNMIFPPSIGRWAGLGFPLAIAGFLASGVGLVVLTLVSTSRAGGSVTDVAKPLGPTVSKIFGASIILAIGPGLAIPRTAATTHEMLQATILPGLNPVLTSIIFFSIVLILVLNPADVINNLGKFLTPVLVVSISGIIIKGFFNPLGPIIDNGSTNHFIDSFQLGYQTMDALAAFVFTSVVIFGYKEMGVTDKDEQIELTIKSGITAGILLSVIYGGLLYIGATTSSLDLGDIGRVDLLVLIADELLGTAGLYALSIAMTMACLTTAIGLSSAVGNFFHSISDGKIKEKPVLIVSVLFSALMSLGGVEYIITVSAPILEFMYPIAIVLVFLNLFNQQDNKPVFLGATIGTAIYSVIYTINNFSTNVDLLEPFTIIITNLVESFIWIIFAIIGILGAKLIYNRINKK